MKAMKHAGRVAAAMASMALAALLAACGGGGGSSGPTWTVSIDSTAIQTNGDAATGVNVGTTDRISITSSSKPTSGVYVRWSYTTRGIAYARLEGSDMNLLTLSVDFVEPDTLPNGEYDDTIQLEVAEDQAFTKPLPGSPFKITSAYVVQNSTVQAAPPLAPSPRSQFAHDVVDAAMSPSLHAVVMTSAAPDDALYLFDIDTGLEQKLPLPKAATALGLTPDGRYAAVGHDAMVTWVDLTTLGQGAPVVSQFGVPTVAWNVVPDGLGAIHVFPAADQWVAIYSIDVASGTVQSGYSVYAQTRAKLHPAGDRVYTLPTLLSPENIDRWAISNGGLLHTSSMPYWGDWSLCGDFWFAQAGDRVYTACGNTFTSTPDAGSDLVYAGAITTTATGGTYAPSIPSLSDSSASGQVVFFDAGRCGIQGGVTPCTTLLRVDETTFGTAVSAWRLPLVFPDGANASRQQGAFVFHAPDDTVITLARAMDATDPAKAWYVDAPFVTGAAKAQPLSRAAHPAAATGAASLGHGERMLRR